MDIQKELIEYLKANLTGVGIFADEIPETEPVPAIALYNVAFTNSRVLSGDKTKNWSAWRITVVDTVQHLQTAIDQILLLDNTGNANFQKLFFELTLKELKASTEPHQRAFIDVRVYTK
jgi:hypothetical protein